MDRARAFLQERGKKLAVGVLPLAAILVSAAPLKADVSPFSYLGYNSGNGAVSLTTQRCTTPGGGTCTGATFNASIQPSSLNGIYGISLSGDATATAPSPSPPGGWDLIWDIGGQGSGEQLSSGTQVPISFNFTVDTGDPSASYYWTLNVSFNADPPNTGITRFFLCLKCPTLPPFGSGLFSGGPDFSGTQTFDSTSLQAPTVVSLPSQVDNWDVSLDVHFYNSPGDPSVGGTINIDPVPEPSALLSLGAMGLGTMCFGTITGLLRRKRT